MFHKWIYLYIRTNFLLLCLCLLSIPAGLTRDITSFQRVRPAGMLTPNLLDFYNWVDRCILGPQTLKHFVRSRRDLTILPSNETFFFIKKRNLTLAMSPLSYTAESWCPVTPMHAFKVSLLRKKELLFSLIFSQVQTDKWTESGAYEPTVQRAQVGLKMGWTFHDRLSSPQCQITLPSMSKDSNDSKDSKRIQKDSKRIQRILLASE